MSNMADRRWEGSHKKRFYILEKIFKSFHSVRVMNLRDLKSNCEIVDNMPSN